MTIHFSISQMYAIAMTTINNGLTSVTKSNGAETQKTAGPTANIRVYNYTFNVYERRQKGIMIDMGRSKQYGGSIIRPICELCGTIEWPAQHALSVNIVFMYTFHAHAAPTQRNKWYACCR